MGNGNAENAAGAVMEYLWLTYYNDTLYAKGIITESERNRMRLAIMRRAAAAGN